MFDVGDTAALLVDEVLPSQPVRQWVLSVPFALRFLFAREPEVMGSVLAIVIRAVSGHLIAKAGFTQAQDRTGAVTLIQRFGGALNLNIHYHMLFLDGVYVKKRGRGHRFVQVEALTTGELTRLVVQISERVGRHLEKRGLLVQGELMRSIKRRCPGVRDAETANLKWEDEEEATALDDLAGHDITYRIAVGPITAKKLSRFRHCLPSKRNRIPQRQSRVLPGFPCTQALQQKHISVRNLSDSADTLVDRRWPNLVCQ